MAHSHGLILTWNSDLSRQTHTVVHRSRFCPTRPLSGPAPVRGFLPYLMDLVLEREINPGKVFDLELSLADVAEGYLAMDKRRAVKTLLRV